MGFRERLGLKRHPKGQTTPKNPTEAEPIDDSAAQEVPLPRVTLDSLSGNDGSQSVEITKRREALWKSLEELEAVLQARSQKSSTRSPAVKACIDEAERHPSPKDLIQALRKDHEERSQSASSKAGSFMQKLFPLSKLALTLTGALVSNAGYPPVQIATNALIQVFELAMNVPKQSAAVLAGLDSLYVDEHLLAELEKLPAYVLEEAIVVSALELQISLIKFLHKSILWMDRNFLAKMGKSLIEATVIEDAKSDLQKSQQLLQRALADETYLTTKWQQIATVQANLLDSLCTKEFHNTHLSKQRELHSSRLEDSNLWAINHPSFIQWRNSDAGILWCPGLPGAGKTFVISRIIDELEIFARHRNIGIAYVFCQFNRSEQQSQRVIIEALTRQLLARKPELCFKFKSMLENPIPTLSDRKALLKDAIAEFQETFLMLDALDEYSADYVERFSLGALFKEIVYDCDVSNVKCCITSREAESIWQMLSLSTISCQRMQICSSEQDIVHLVETLYEQSSSAIGWLRDNQALRQIAVTQVLEKSSRVFKLAELQIKSALRKQSPKAMRTALENLTTDVNAYYQESMQRIAEQVETGTIVLKLLTWLTYTRSPIYTSDLQLALSIEPGQSLDAEYEDLYVDISRYIGLSEGLVSTGSVKPNGEFWSSSGHDPVNIKGHQVRLAHESVRDYFRTYQAWVPNNGDALILQACLTAMSSPIFLEHLPTIWEELLPRELRGYMLKGAFTVEDGGKSLRIPEFLLWAISNWGHYLKQDQLSAEVKAMLCQIHRTGQIRTDEWMRENGILYSFQTPPPSPDCESRDSLCKSWVGSFESLKQPHAATDIEHLANSWELGRPPPQFLPKPRTKIVTQKRLSSNEMTRSSGMGVPISFPSISNAESEGVHTRKHTSFLRSFTRKPFSLHTTGPKAGLLYWSAQKGWLEACRFLLPLEKDPNLFFYTVGKDLRWHAATPLSAAVMAGNLELVRLFLKDDRIDSDFGRFDDFEGHKTPLMEACDNDDATIVQILLAQKGVDINSGGIQNALPPIFRARKTTIPLLLARKDLNVNDSNLGLSPIHHIVEIGGLESELRLTLQHPKVDVNARTDLRKLSKGHAIPITIRQPAFKVFECSRTALMVAALLGHSAETDILLREPRTNAQLRDGIGMSPLMLAAMGHKKEASVPNTIQRHAETLEGLLNSLSNQINWQDQQGHTAIMFAAMCGIDPREYVHGQEYDHRDISHFIPITKTLLKVIGLEVNLPNDAGHTPLDHANFTEGLIIRDRDHEIQYLRRVYENKTTLYVPETSENDVWNDAKDMLEVVESIRTLLKEAGAEVRTPIPIPPVPKAREPRFYMLKRRDSAPESDYEDDMVFRPSRASSSSNSLSIACSEQEE